MLNSARRDMVVDPCAHDHAARHLPDVELNRYQDAYHEMWMKPANKRSEVWRKVESFLTRKLPGIDFTPRPQNDNLRQLGLQHRPEGPAPEARKRP